MIFGPIRGFRPDRSWQHELVGACWLATLFCWAGYFNGYVTRAASGELQHHAFEWTTGAVVYTVGMWLAWAIGIWAAGHYKEPQPKWGAWLFLSLPVCVFVFLAFGLADLDIPTRG